MPYTGMFGPQEERLNQEAVNPTSVGVDTPGQPRAVTSPGITKGNPFLFLKSTGASGEENFLGRHPFLGKMLEAGLFGLSQPTSASEQADPLGGIRHGARGLLGYLSAVAQKPEVEAQKAFGAQKQAAELANLEARTAQSQASAEQLGRAGTGFSGFTTPSGIFSFEKSTGEVKKAFGFAPKPPKLPSTTELERQAKAMLPEDATDRQVALQMLDIKKQVSAAGAQVGFAARGGVPGTSNAAIRAGLRYRNSLLKVTDKDPMLSMLTGEFRSPEQAREVTKANEAKAARINSAFSDWEDAVVNRGETRSFKQYFSELERTTQKKQSKAGSVVGAFETAIPTRIP